jgi:hypothetical protein
LFSNNKKKNNIFLILKNKKYYSIYLYILFHSNKWRISCLYLLSIYLGKTILKFNTKFPFFPFP